MSPIHRLPNLVELLRERGAQQSGQKAYAFLADGEREEESLTWGQLERRAQAIGAWLQSRGLAGERVLLLYPPGLDYISAFFGCLFAGSTAVPLYPPRPNRGLDRLQAVTADAQAKAALTTASILSLIEAQRPAGPFLKALDLLDSDGLDEDLAELWKDPGLDGSSSAFLQYTSGSTSAPKGVMVSHGNLAHNARLACKAFGHGPHTVFAGWLPLYHDMGLIGNVLQPFHLGVPSYLMPPLAFLQKPVRWLQAVTRFKATTSGGPDFAYALCARKVLAEEKEGLDLSSWQVAFNGAEPVRRQTLESFARAFECCGFCRDAFYPCYGLAEATLFVSGGLPGRGASVIEAQADALARNRALPAEPGQESRSLVSCGRAWLDQKIVIADPETGRPCPDGQVGEIWVSGPSAAQGYWNNPQETERVFQARLLTEGKPCPDPFLRTGDLGFFLEGELYVTGRAKELIIIRGLNHYPQDIEAAVQRSHPCLRPGCGAAFAVEADGEERLAVVQEVDRQYRRKLDVDEVADAIRRQVSEEHEVQAWTVSLIRHGSLPKTTSGKIQRRLCRQMFLDGTLKEVGRSLVEQQEACDSGAAALPQSFILRAVRGLDSEQARHSILMLHLQEQAARSLRADPSRLDPQAPLSTAGLDSLAAVELKNAIEADLGVTVPLGGLLEGPSPSQLAHQVLGLLKEPHLQPSPPSPASGKADEEQLSYGQKALWFLHRLAPESPAYNISGAVRIAAGLDPTALQRSVEALAQRHSLLQATFQEEDGLPAQRIHPQAKPAFQLLNASGWSEAALKQRLGEESRRPFDLEKGPLLRILLLARQDGHVMLLTVHHIVADFWSLGIFLQELGRLYPDCRAPLPELPVQYSDYVRRQAQALAGAEGERLWAYWQKALPANPPLLDLPLDRPRPPAQSFRGGSVPLCIGPQTARQIRSLGEACGATLFMTLLAGFQAWLHRVTRQDEVLVGSPASGRSSAEWAGLVGYFVNPVVLKADCGADPRFEEFLVQVRQTALRALEHQDFPFALLVERLQPERDLSRSPIFQAMFVLQKAHLFEEPGLASLSLGEAGSPFELGRLSLAPLPLEEQVAQFDLRLSMAWDEGAESLLGSLQYNADVFDRASARRWARQLHCLLASAADDPRRRISELPLLDEAALHQLTVEWNDSQAGYPQDRCLPDLFCSQAERAPDALAVVLEDAQLSYGGLEARANCLAHHLKGLGTVPETVLGLLCEPSLELVTGLLGVVKAGGAYLPLLPAYPEERRAFMLGEARAPALLTQRRLAESHSSPLPCPAFCLDSDRNAAAHPDSPPHSAALPGNLAYLIYTSGSTGRPKGVAVAHRAVARLVFNTNYVQLGPGDRLTQASNIAFDVSAFEIWGALLHGALLILVPSQAKLSPRRLIDLLRRHEAGVVNLVPSLFNQLADEDAGAFSKVNDLMLAGEALDPETARRVLAQGPPQRLLNVYGPTENATFSTWHQARRVPAGASSVPIGRPISNSGAHILDRNLGTVPIGVPGELHLSGDGLARGYLGRAAQTAQRFIPHPFSRTAGERLYKTGDLAICRPDGAIDFLGRLDHQVKLRGFRVELGEIEAVLAQHPQVGQSVVVNRSDGGIERLTAYLAAGKGEDGKRVPLDAQQLRSFLQKSLPEYMIPSVFVVLDQLPLTANGKVDRQALPEPQREEESAWQPPETPGEEMLAAVWCETLGLEKAGRNDHFFELGGHSLLAIQLTSRIRRKLGADLSVRSVFTAPRLCEMARLIDQARLPERAEQAPLRPVPHQGGLPLASAQQRLWLLDQLEPASPLYNMAAALRLKGPLDHAALQTALGEIVRRHEALRTCFPSAGGKAEQKVLDWSPLPLPVLDLPSEGRRTEVRRLLKEEARRPFDLAGGPLLRTRLLRLAPEDHLLSLTVHHIVCDGWSLGILVRELSALYAPGQGGACPARLPALPIQYADYAHWQQQRLQDPSAEEQLRFWKRNLAGAPLRLELPSDRPRPSKAGFDGRTLGFAFSPQILDGMKQLCRQEACSLFMALAAAFQALLMRHSGQEDFLMGVPMANRDLPEVRNLIGFFVNNLVLRADLSGDPDFRRLLHRVREACLDAYAHQGIPFEKLVQTLRPDRDMGRNPLYQAVFGLQNVPAARLQLEGLEAAPLTVETGTSKFDLSLFLEETPQGLSGTVEYSSELFDAATVRRLIEHYRTLCQAAASDPACRLSALPLLPQAQLHQVLTEWNSPAQDLEEAPAVLSMFEERAKEAPDSAALAQQEQTLSYGELDRRTRQLARHIESAGIELEAPVGVFAERSPDLILAFLGILKAGCAYLPVDPAYSPQRIAFLLEDAGAPLLLSQQALRSRLPSGLQQVFYLDQDWPTAAQQPAQALERPTDRSLLAYVIYTSGSTGRPKGSMIEHGALADYNRAACAAYGVSRGDRVLQFCSLSFDISIEEIVPCLTQGAALVLRNDEMLDSMAIFLHRSAQWSISLMSLPTAFWHEMVDRMESGQLRLPDCLRLVIIAGERAIPERLAAWRKRTGGRPRLVNTYGLTESTIISTAGDLSRPGLDAEKLREVPVGGPIAGTRLHLLDPRMRPVPAGVPGEVHIGGSLLARGYRNRPAATAGRFIPNSFSRTPGSRLYRTGDLARRLPDGDLEFLGRIDHQVKIRGYRIELGEIEACISRHPQVEKTVVLALEDRPGSKRLAAYVVAVGSSQSAVGRSEESNPESDSNLKPEAWHLKPESLRPFLARDLPEYMIPSAFAFLQQLPLTPNGKVDREALAKVPLESVGEYSAPQGLSEELLAGIWSDLLGVERVGRQDSFFELGGHSLLATQAASRISEAFGLELPLRTLFEAPTPAALARRLDQARKPGREAAAEPIPLLDRSKPLPLSFAQERLWFLEQLGPPSPLYNLSAALHLEGKLHPPALQAALDEVRRRHETLRTRFAQADGKPLQEVQDAGQTALPLADLTALPPPLRDAELQRLSRQEARRCFDLAKGGLLRACLVRLQGQHHALLASLHHIISDGWSLAVLVDELGALYRACSAGRPSPLAALPVQYADFAAWQRQRLRGERLDEQVRFWKERLQGAAALQMPTDRPRPAVMPHQGDAAPFSWPAGLLESLRSVSRRLDCTLFMTMLAALQALLYRFTGQTDISVGVPVANRTRREAEGLIGFFVNMLVMRAQVQPSLSLRRLAGRARQFSLEAYARQDVPFEKLVDELAAKRDPSRTPLFQVSLAWEDEPLSLQMPGLQVQLEELSSGTSRFDLSFFMNPCQGGIEGWVEFSTALFDRTTVVRLMEHFRILLQSLLADPKRRLDELPLLTEGQRLQLLSEWNDTACAFDDCSPVQQRFSQWARRTPQAAAVQSEGRCWSYCELDRRADALAGHLAALGAGPEKVVAVAADRSPEMVLGNLAVLKSGAAYLPIDPSYPPERILFMLSDSQALAVLTTQGRLESIPRQGPQRVCLDGPWEAQEDPQIPCPRRPAELQDLAYVIYTSGSTGRPKGVAVSHGGLLNLVDWHRRTYSVGLSDRATLVASPAFDAAVWEMWPYLSAGAALHIPDAESRGVPAKLVEWLTRQEATIAFLPTPLAEEALRQPWPPQASLRALLTGGDRLHGLSGLRLPCPLYNHYGPTEASVVTTAGASDCAGGAAPPIGRPISNFRTFLLDAAGLPVPMGAAGEICIGGRGLARGYLHQPAWTAQRFVPDPFSDDRNPGGRLYRSGDLARWRPDGQIDFLGRADQQVKVRGFRIELGEIETLLGGHPAVREAALDVRQGQLAAYLVPAKGSAVSSTELRDFAGRKLPQHMVPGSWVFVEQLPTTPNGKLDRKALPDPQPERPAALELVPPRNRTEEKLSAIWSELLGTGPIGIHDDFFELGGYSLLVPQVTSEVRKEFGVDLRLEVFFTSPTIAGLAAEIEQRAGLPDALTPPAITPIRRERPPPGGSQSEGERELQPMGGPVTSGRD